jgi:hypothetical protein
MIEIEEARRIAGYCFLLMRIGNKAPVTRTVGIRHHLPSKKIAVHPLFAVGMVERRTGPRAISGLSPSFSGSTSQVRARSDACLDGELMGPVVGRCLHLQMQVPGSEILVRIGT